MSARKRKSKLGKERRSLPRGGLTDSFLDCVRIFEEKIEERFRILPLTMMWTGGFERYMKRPLKADERFEDWEKEFITMDNARSYFGFLTEAMEIKEDFLILSLVTGIDHFLKNLASQFPQELEKRKQYQEPLKYSFKGVKGENAAALWREVTKDLRKELKLFR